MASIIFKRRSGIEAIRYAPFQVAGIMVVIDNAVLMDANAILTDATWPVQEM